MEVNGERKAKYKRLINMKISGEAIERLEDEASVDRSVNGNDHSRMKHTTPGNISRPIPITHTQKTSVSTTTSTGVNTVSA